MATPVMSPYVIGGVGMYNGKVNGATESTTDMGLNGGVGLRFSLGGLSTFGEVRYHHVFAEGTAYNYVPLTFGIEF